MKPGDLVQSNIFSANGSGGYGLVMGSCDTEAQHFGKRVLPHLKTCSLPHAYGRVPNEIPATPLGTGMYGGLVIPLLLVKWQRTTLTAQLLIFTKTT